METITDKLKFKIKELTAVVDTFATRLIRKSKCKQINIFSTIEYLVTTKSVMLLDLNGNLKSLGGNGWALTAIDENNFYFLRYVTSEGIMITEEIE